MARPSERRAALERLTGAQRTDDDTTTEQPSMKLSFVSIDLHKALPRLDSGRGQATQDTTRFNVAQQGVTIEFDTATQLVRLSKGTACHYVPLHGVERFGMTVEDSAIHAKAQADIAAAKAKAIADAQAETDRLAAVPA